MAIYIGCEMVNFRVDGKMVRNVELIIFDKDGTLFQLYPFWSELAAKRAQILRSMVNPDDHNIEDELVRSMGVDKANKRMFSDGPIGIYPRKHIVKTVQSVLHKHAYEIDERSIEAAFIEADEYLNDPATLKRTMIPVKGAFDFLDCLKGKCVCAILSSDKTARLEQVASIFGIRHHFALLVGGDQTLISKPDPWGAKKIMEDLGISPERTVFIGDSITDIECACNAGCAHKIAIISDITDTVGVAARSGLLVHDFTGFETLP